VQEQVAGLRGLEIRSGDLTAPREFEPIGLLSINPRLMVGKKSLPAMMVKQGEFEPRSV
jgi:hypothetical protein